MKKYWEYLKQVSPFIMVILAILYIRSCQNESDTSNRYQDNLKVLTAKEKTIKLKNGELATQKELFSVTKKEMNDQIWMKDDTIKQLLKKSKDPLVVIKWNTRIEYDTIFAPFSSVVPFEFSRTFNNIDPWYSISGTVNQFGIKLNPPIIPNTQRLLIDYVRGKPTATITNSNPHIVTDGIEGQVIDIPKKRWVIGVGGVVDITGNPTFGVFVGRKIFEF